MYTTVDIFFIKIYHEVYSKIDLSFSCFSAFIIHINLRKLKEKVTILTVDHIKIHDYQMTLVKDLHIQMI